MGTGIVTEAAIIRSGNSYDAGSLTAAPHLDDIQQALTPCPSLLDYRDPSSTARRPVSSLHQAISYRKESGEDLLQRRTSSTLAERVRKHV